MGTRTLATYTYESGNGLMQKMTYGNGHTVQYSYDELERISKVYYNGSTTPALSYIYTGTGALGKVIDHANGRIYTYNYDSLGRLISMAEYLSDGSLCTAADYTYDTANRVTRWEVQLPDRLGDVSESYVYNSSASDSIPRL